MRYRFVQTARSMLCALAGLAASSNLAAAGTPWLVYLGTYTGTKSQGIYVSRFDPQTGWLTTPELAVEAKNPSFLALHPSHRFIYSVGEIEDFGGNRSGSVSAYRIDNASGKLTLLNQQSSGGTSPCHLALDATGKCLLVANYGNGSIAALPIRADGTLDQPGATIQHQGSSVDPQRQTGPHAHFITTDAANRFAFCCDLGLDKVLIYRLEVNRASLVPNDPPSVSVKPGAGPRHLAFHPNGRFAYFINEMGSSLTAFAYDPNRGKLTELQTVSTLPPTFNGLNSCAEVQLHPSGNFAYASNRGHDSIAIFGVDSKTGKLTGLGHQLTQGKTPRHFGFAPDGKWLLAENQDSDTIMVFRVDAGTGKLIPTGKPIPAASPVCVVFVPTASF